MFWAGFEFVIGAAAGLIALAVMVLLIAAAVQAPRATLGLLIGFGVLVAFVVASPQQITAAGNVLAAGVAVIVIVAVFWGLGAAILKRYLRPEGKPNDAPRD